MIEQDTEAPDPSGFIYAERIIKQLEDLKDRLEAVEAQLAKLLSLSGKW